MSQTDLFGKRLRFSIARKFLNSLYEKTGWTTGMKIKNRKKITGKRVARCWTRLQTSGNYHPKTKIH